MFEILKILDQRKSNPQTNRIEVFAIKKFNSAEVIVWHVNKLDLKFTSFSIFVYQRTRGDFYYK